MYRAALVPQFFVTAAMAWVPPVALGVLAATWHDRAAQVPSHWDFTGTPELVPSSTLLASAIIPSVICAVVATAAALFLDDDTGTWSAASGLGVLVTVGAAVGLQWPVAQLSAGPALHNRIGTPFLLYLAALAWGGLAFLVGATRRSRVEPEPGPRPHEDASTDEA